MKTTQKYTKQDIMDISILITNLIAEGRIEEASLYRTLLNDMIDWALKNKIKHEYRKI